MPRPAGAAPASELTAVGSLRYHLKELTKLWQAFARQARAARADSGVSLPRQLWDLATLRLGSCKLNPEDYYKLRVYRKELSSQEKRRYISNQALPQNMVGRWKVVADDKLLTYCLLNDRGIPTPKIYAISHPLREFRDVLSLKTPAEVADYLRRRAPYPMIAKPIRGMYSKDVWLLESYDPGTDRVRMSGQDVAPEEIGKRCFERKTGHLFQELLRPHADIRQSISEKICTLRLIVLLDQGAPRLMKAVWKVAASKNLADNYWREGNFMAKLDQQSGQILQCMSGLGPDFRLLDRHPVTGAPLKGFQVPCYREAVELVLEASRVFPDIVMQAWDIAITDDGPIPLELNVIGSLFIPQIIDQKGLWEDGFRDLVESYRAQA